MSRKRNKKIVEKPIFDDKTLGLAKLKTKKMGQYRFRNLETDGNINEIFLYKIRFLCVQVYSVYSNNDLVLLKSQFALAS